MTDIEGSYAPTDAVFEVTVPNGDLEKILALRGLVEALGLQLRDSEVAIAEDEKVDSAVITGQQLSDVSMDLWGDEAYGRAASELLIHEWGTVQYRTDKDGNVVPVSLAQTLNPGLRQIGHIDPSVSKDTRREQAQVIWESLRSPYSCDIQSVKDSSFGSIVLSPDKIVVDHLKSFVLRRQYDKHSLHGTLGKALDVMSVAAGVRDSVSEHLLQDLDDEFITMHQLVDAMDAELPKKHRNALLEKITEKVWKQYISGVPNIEGELITKDTLLFHRRRYARRDTVFALFISLSSLAALATVSSEGAPKEFLRKISQNDI